MGNLDLPVLMGSRIFSGSELLHCLDANFFFNIENIFLIYFSELLQLDDDATVLIRRPLQVRRILADCQRGRAEGYGRCRLLIYSRRCGASEYGRLGLLICSRRSGARGYRTYWFFDFLSKRTEPNCTVASGWTVFDDFFCPKEPYGGYRRHWLAEVLG